MNTREDLILSEWSIIETLESILAKIMDTIGKIVNYIFNKVDIDSSVKLPYGTIEIFNIYLNMTSSVLNNINRQKATKSYMVSSLNSILTVSSKINSLNKINTAKMYKVYSSNRLKMINQSLEITRTQLKSILENGRYNSKDYKSELTRIVSDMNTNINILSHIVMGSIKENK